jgi:hypothetical protein
MVPPYLCPEPPQQAIVSMMEADYGFSLVNLGESEEDLSVFHRLVLSRDEHLDAFCSIDDLDEQVALFLEKIGPNPRDEVVDPCVALIHEIAVKIMEASGKGYAWFFLRATPPTDAYDLPRWHMDGYYYKDLKREKVQYKFVTALLGPSTYFYLLPNTYEELRRNIWAHMRQRSLIAQICSNIAPVSLRTGEGAFFIASNVKRAALHSEPPIHEDRLFFSIVPCDESDLASMKERILANY